MQSVIDTIRGIFYINMPATKDLLVGEYIINVLVAVVLTYTIIYLVRASVSRFFKHATFVEEKRKQTIESIIKNTSSYVIFIIILIAIVQPFMGNFKELLLAGGLIAAVVGFGAQKVINDLLSGLFMIFEQTIRKGDFINLNEELEGGTVEEIGFRITKIRLVNGKLVTISNGEVRKVVNGSVDKRRIFEPVVISFREDPSKVQKLLEEVCVELNERQQHLLMKDESSEDGFLEKYNFYGLSSLDATPYGLKFIIAATVHDTDFLPAAQEAKMVMAQKLYDNNIKFAESQMYYRTRTSGN